MFEWLQQEISAIKTPRFHIVDGPAEPRLREAVIRSDLPLPWSYREFVIKFGNARLYRRPANDSYCIGVFASPRETISGDGTRIYHIGFHDGASVYIKEARGASKFPIYEFEGGMEEKVAADFEEWLTVSCARARDAYGKGKWANILRGPKAFTPEELQIIEARKQIDWRVLGIDPDGNQIIEVRNNSTRTVPVLTLGARSRDGRLNGAFLLRIGHIGPGQSDVLHASCYKDLKPPQEIEVFALPEPRPEDRERYGEFRNPK